jgi:hypothetical protein
LESQALTLSTALWTLPEASDSPDQPLARDVRPLTQAVPLFERNCALLI